MDNKTSGHRLKGAKLILSSTVHELSAQKHCPECISTVYVWDICREFAGLYNRLPSQICAWMLHEGWDIGKYFHI